MKSGLVITVGVLLCFYCVANLFGGIGTYTKAGMIRGTLSFGDSVDKMTNHTPGKNEQARKSSLQNSQMFFYGLALVIFILAILSLVTAIGLFGAKEWAPNALLGVIILGALVEVQDLAEDGFGLMSAIWIGVLVLSAVALAQIKQSQIESPELVRVED